LIASAIIFGIQGLALTDSKFPVWYPYYGTWFAGIVVEIALFILLCITRSPVDAFDYITIVIRVLRIGAFILLPALYFGFRNDKKQYDNSDAERQSLLRKKLAPKPSSSEDSTLNGNGTANGNGNGNGHGYGTTTDAAAEDSDSEADPNEDRWVKEERRAKKLMMKRLKQDGNWFTYAKGFMVSMARCPTCRYYADLYSRFSSHMFGPHATGVFKFEQYLLAFVYFRQMP
jgi:hypothetical protein